MSDSVHIGRSVKNLKESPAFNPFSGVRLFVGEDSDGEAVVYTAGDDSGRVLEVKNPWGSQQMANDILRRIRGYEYKPFTATGTYMNPAAELGDVVTVGDVYSVLNSVSTTFSPLMSADLAARDSGALEHEYPYDAKSNRETARAIGGLRSQFIVDLNRVESTIAATYETKTEAGRTKTELQSQITQTRTQILSTVSATYETKAAAQQMETRLNSSIEQTASSITSTVSATYETKASAAAKLTEAKGYTNTQTSAVRTDLQSQITQSATSITSTVASAVSKFKLPSGINITMFGYGRPANSTAGANNGKYFLDQASGIYYKSNGTSWVKQNSTPLPLITDTLQSRIEQTARSISLEVSGANAPEWTVGDYYAVGDIVKVSTYTDGIMTAESFYRCKQINTATNANKPGNATYWETADAPTVQSLIDINLDKITIGTSASDRNNSAQITLYRDGIEIAAQTITMSNVVADSISASKITSGTMQAETIGIDGSLSVYVDSNDERTYCGALGGGFALQPDNPIHQVSTPSIAMYSDDRYSYVAVSNGQYSQPSGAPHGAYRGFAILHTRLASVYTTSAIVKKSNTAGTYVDYNPYAVMESNNGQYYVSFGVSGGLTTGISQASDRRIKKDIDYDLSRYERLFMLLKPCSYRLIQSAQTIHTGFVAQDVEDALSQCEILDSALVTRHGEEARGFSTDDPLLALELDEITAIHTHMIQRLIERISELESRFSEQKVSQ